MRSPIDRSHSTYYDGVLLRNRVFGDGEFRFWCGRCRNMGIVPLHFCLKIPGTAPGLGCNDKLRRGSKERKKNKQKRIKTASVSPICANNEQKKKREKNPRSLAPRCRRHPGVLCEVRKGEEAFNDTKRVSRTRTDSVQKAGTRNKEGPQRMCARRPCREDGTLSVRGGRDDSQHFMVAPGDPLR